MTSTTSSQVSTRTMRQFITFIFVGVINTVFGYSMFALCIYAGLHFTVANLISTILGILFNFKTIGSIVFKDSNKRLLLKFIGVYTVLYLISSAIIALINQFTPNLYLAGIISTLMTPPLAFYLNKRFVFCSPQTSY